MKISAFFPVLAASLLLGQTAAAANFRLDCVMNNYGTARLVPGITAIVPQKAVHVVNATDVVIRDTQMHGTAEDAGSRIKLRYYGKLKGVGDVEVVYTYIKSSGRMSANTRALKVIQWEEDYPERAAKYVIAGQCQMR